MAPLYLRWCVQDEQEYIRREYDDDYDDQYDDLGINVDAPSANADLEGIHKYASSTWLAR